MCTFTFPWLSPYFDSLPLKYHTLMALPSNKPFHVSSYSVFREIDSQFQFSGNYLKQRSLLRGACKWMNFRHLLEFCCIWSWKFNEQIQKGRAWRGRWTLITSIEGNRHLYRKYVFTTTVYCLKAVASDERLTIDMRVTSTFTWDRKQLTTEQLHLNKSGNHRSQGKRLQSLSPKKLWYYSLSLYVLNFVLSSKFNHSISNSLPP